MFYDIGTRFSAAGVDRGSAENNAAMYPRLVAAVMAGLLALQAIRIVLQKMQDEPWPGLVMLVRPHIRAIVIFLAFLAYLWAFRWFGFVYATPVFLLVTQVVMGYRHPVSVVGYSIGVTAAVYFAFSEILNLALPAGDLFG